MLYLEREVPGYEGLEYSAQLLEAALQARNSFLGIEEIEFQYRGSLQQQFYNKVFELLSQNLSQTIFLKMLERLVKQYQANLKSEEGKIALQTYLEEFQSLASNNELGIKLFYEFKRNNFKDFFNFTKNL